MACYRGRMKNGVTRRSAQSKATDLTARQRLLVDTLVATGCSITEAAQMAGYSGGSGADGARVTASRTLRLPHVQRYLRERMQQSFGLEAPRALATLRHLNAAGASEYVRYHAASSILDRAGYGRLSPDEPERRPLILKFNFSSPATKVEERQAEPMILDLKPNRQVD